MAKFCSGCATLKSCALRTKWIIAPIVKEYGFSDSDMDGMVDGMLGEVLLIGAERDDEGRFGFTRITTSPVGTFIYVCFL